MEIKGRGAIGAALILIGGVSAGCEQNPPAGAKFSLATADNGAAGFHLLLEPDAWQLVTEHKGQGWSNELLDRHVHAQIDALIEQGLRNHHIDCGRHWLLSEVIPLQGGGIVFSGFCASDAELRAARHHIGQQWDGAT